MRLILALGAAVAATTVMAHAQTEERTERTHIVVRHGGHGAMDADNDGWISRAESSAAADRIFADLDRNGDGRLDQADRPPHQNFELHFVPDGDELRHGDNCERTESGDGANRRVTIICRDERAESGDRERRVMRWSHREGDDDNCERTETGEGENRRVTVICRDERRGGGDVIIRRHGDGEHPRAMIAPMPPHPPMAPLAPMFTMFMGDESEADLNNDGAISQDEFRRQHLRMFDAQDANGDGRIRAHRMPAPPAPPTPPTPPSPPRRG